MAWNTRWQLQFTSIDGNAYTLNIQQNDYSGTVTQLTGAEQPFVTQEDDDDNIFTPIRTQTGYINVIDRQGGLLKEIMPTTPLQNYVVLMLGNEIKWQGFVSQEAYTQEWIEAPADPQDSPVPTEITIPVNGLLESLKYVSLPLTDFATEDNIAKLIYKLFTLLSVMPYTLAVGGADIHPGIWLSYVLKWYVLFNPRTQTNSGVEYTGYDSLNGYEIMEYICTLFCKTAREDGNRLVLSSPTCSDIRGQFPFSSLNQFTSNTSPASFDVRTYDMMTAFTWRGDNNKVNYLEGLKSVQATLPLYTNALDVVEIPDAEENLDPVLSVEAIDFDTKESITVYMQPHEPRGAEFMETYRYDMYQFGTDPQSGYLIPMPTGSSSYTEVKNTTVFNPVWRDYIFESPFVQSGATMPTGSFPCRWSSDGKSYQSGIFMQFILRYPWSSYTLQMYPLYSIKSRISFRFDEGYFRLQFRMSGFSTYHLVSSSNYTLYYRDHNFGGNFRLLVYIRLGAYYWDGSAWTTTRTYCLLEITNGQPPQNWDVSMGVKENDGYYIPISSEMTGVMQFEILNMAVRNSATESYDYYRRNIILSDFVFEKAQTSNPLVASRTQNIYRLSIDENQSEERALDLKFGTWNSNSDNPVFLKDEQGNYIENGDYYVYGSQRIEMHMLYLIKEYYQAHRHSYEAMVNFSHRLPVHRITHNNRTYAAIAADRQWRDDQTRVKFIDVTVEVNESISSSQSANIEFEEEPQEVSGIEESTEPITNEQQEENT